MPVGIMRYEVARTAKKLREDAGVSTLDMAKQLGLSEKEYIDFEECRSSPEDDYYIISAIAFTHGMTCENFFRTVKGEDVIIPVMGEVFGITAGFQKKLISLIERLGYIGKEEFEWLEKEKGGFKFSYLDYDGVLQYAALYRSDEMHGDYLVVLNDEAHIAKIGIYDGEKCFKIKDRMYPIHASSLAVFGKIYSGIEPGV